MKVVAISDMHGQLEFSVPEADLLLIAGDLCPASHDPWMSLYMQEDWLNIELRYWLADQPIKECVAVAGNHDWIWEKDASRVPKLNKNFHYIEDESIEILGVKIYGTPVQLPFNDWAFNREEKRIQSHWDNIPEGLDILLLHSPPYGILDETHHPNYASEHIGSKSLMKRIKKVNPRYVIFGHNHGAYGVEEHDGITYVNASLVDEEYKMNKEPIILEIE
jgi:Icc-related predicted phosphoesterase